jgi:16S rRNA (cytidine1402-2'-O)-methyltransferase
MPHGTLYIVSTPIGNLEDLTLRARRVLAEVDGILAEDTRRTGQLLHHLGIRTPMRSLHRHNERAREAQVLERLEAGASLALVSDAGTPLVSDPGEGLVARVRAAGHAVVPVPGASAVLAALVTSGLAAVPFTFLGFPPRKGRERRGFLARLRETPHTVVLFESPERTARFLGDLAALGPDAATREVALVREVTKLHEEVRRGTVAELAAYYGEEAPRGEVTLVVGPAPGEAAGGEAVAGAGEAVDEGAVRALGLALLAEGASPSRAAREVARRLGLPRNRVYARIQELADEAGSPSAPPPSEPGALPGPPSEAEG